LIGAKIVQSSSTRDGLLMAEQCFYDGGEAFAALENGILEIVCAREQMPPPLQIKWRGFEQRQKAHMQSSYDSLKKQLKQLSWCRVPKQHEDRAYLLTLAEEGMRYHRRVNAISVDHLERLVSRRADEHLPKDGLLEEFKLTYKDLKHLP
jgi:hypothetical protein